MIDGDLLLEKNKNIVRSFFEKANKIRGTPVDMVTEDFKAHIADARAINLIYAHATHSNFFPRIYIINRIIMDVCISARAVCLS
jgi:hypothetical protein